MKPPAAANDNAKLDVLLRLPDVMQATGLGSSTIYRKIAANTFPRPLRLGPGSVRWRTSAIVAWTDGLEPQASKAA